MPSRKPQWWQLYLLVPSMFALMVLEHLDPLPGVSVQIADMGLTILTFALILMWLKANEAALGREESPVSEESLHNLKITVLNPDSTIQRGDESLRDHAPAVTTHPAIHPRARRMAVRSGDDKRTLT